MKHILSQRKFKLKVTLVIITTDKVPIWVTLLHLQMLKTQQILQKRKAAEAASHYCQFNGHKEKRPWYRLAEMDNTWIVFI